MRSGQLGKNADRWGSLSPATGGRHSGWQTRGDRAADFGRLLDDCTRRLATWDPSDREGALGHAIEVLAHGLMADRVSFFIAARPATGESCGRFESVREWSRSEAKSRRVRDARFSGNDIHLERLPDQGAKLRSGRPLRMSAGIVPANPVGSTEEQWMTIGSRVGSVLYLPCLGPMGLLGFFAIETGVRVDGWSELAMERATLVGALFAGFLERERLAAELDGIRRQMSRGEHLETLGLVASSVAHDFNNVLTAILGYADLAGMEIAEGGAGQSEITEIRNAATRAAALVEEVLAPNRRRPDGAVPVDLSELIGSLDGMLRRIAGKSVDVDFRLSEGIEQVRVDPSRVERALFNLAANAREALVNTSGSEGRFALSTASVDIDSRGLDPSVASKGSAATLSDLKPGRYVRLSVSDNGSGIDREIQSKIFEPFFTTRAKGTGLGLAAVAEMMAESAGAVRVESTPGRGTAFHLYFPVAAGANPDGREKAVESSHSDDLIDPI